MRSARSGSVAARAPATRVSADALEYLLVMELGDAVRRGRGRWLPAPRDSDQRRCLRGLVGDGVGDVFGAVGVGGRPRPRDPVSADAFEDSSVMESAMRSARSGSVAASASAIRSAPMPSRTRQSWSWRCVRRR